MARPKEGGRIGGIGLEEKEGLELGEGDLNFDSSEFLSTDDDSTVGFDNGELENVTQELVVDDVKIDAAAIVDATDG